MVLYRNRIEREVQSQEGRKKCGNLRDETADHSGDGYAGNYFGLGGSHGTEHTDLNADGAQIGESAKGVLGDDPTTVRERVFAAHDRLKVQVGGELVGDQLGGKETRDADNLSPRYTEEEGDGVENVSEDQLERKVVNGKTLSDPSE